MERRIRSQGGWRCWKKRGRWANKGAETKMQAEADDRYCAWGGEEPMLLGSTAWAETHMRELQEHAAIYINTGGNDRGHLSLEGSHSLEHLISEVARSVKIRRASFLRLSVTVWRA